MWNLRSDLSTCVLTLDPEELSYLRQGQRPQHYGSVHYETVRRTSDVTLYDHQEQNSLENK
ncbi:hypothetical protein YC2023_058509 [Brassica napus]